MTVIQFGYQHKDPDPLQETVVAISYKIEMWMANALALAGCLAKQQ